MSIQTAFLGFISILLLGGCDTFSSVEEPVNEGGDRQLAEDLSVQEQIMIGGSNDFAFRLLHRLKDKEEDNSFFVSPLSISTAFGMALNGAADETYEQMRGFFGYDGLTRDEINRANRDLIDLLTTLDPQVIMTIANSVWYREGITVREEFLNNNREYFDADVQELDFSDPGAPDIINAWIDENTEGLIDKMVEAIGEDVIMYLVNAIYFNGDWTVQFDPDDTRDEVFHLPDGDTREVPMMRVEEEFRTYRGEDWTALDMWYGKAGFSFTALVPGGDATLEELVPALTADRFASITEQLEESELNVVVPRFELDYEIGNFPDELEDMGLTLPFGSQADFSGIADLPLAISDVKHRAVIKLDEEGSEAAAATVIEVGLTSTGPSIRLNRPFLFFIRENTSNTILFMGAYTGITNN